MSNSLSNNGSLQCIDGPDLLDPSQDISIGPQILQYVVNQKAGSFLRIYRPNRTVALSNRDRSSQGSDQAIRATLEHGFAPVFRSPGGRAVAYHEQSLALDLFSHDLDPHIRINDRFQEVGEIFVDAFARVGIQSKIGEVPGEYCPGKYSVTTGGAKLVGTAQRLKKGGWHLGASVVVRNALPVRDVLRDVYRSMELAMDPKTVIGLNEINSSISTDQFRAALWGAFQDRYRLIKREFSSQFNVPVAQLLGA